MTGLRWEGDARGEGVADARTFAPGATELLEAMRRRNWVAEEPHVHLLPHLRRAAVSLPVELIDARASADGSFDVACRWTGESQRLAEVRAVVFTLVGSFAEVSTYVRQRRPAQDGGDNRVVFEIVTGFPDGETGFAPHGHTVRLSVAGFR